jgi:hypothetical protein
MSSGDGNRPGSAFHFQVIQVFLKFDFLLGRQKVIRFYEGNPASAEIPVSNALKVEPCIGKNAVPVQNESFGINRVPEGRPNVRHEAPPSLSGKHVEKEGMKANRLHTLF